MKRRTKFDVAIVMIWLMIAAVGVMFLAGDLHAQTTIFGSVTTGTLAGSDTDTLSYSQQTVAEDNGVYSPMLFVDKTAGTLDSLTMGYRVRYADDTHFNLTRIEPMYIDLSHTNYGPPNWVIFKDVTLPADSACYRLAYWDPGDPTPMSLWPDKPHATAYVDRFLYHVGTADTLSYRFRDVYEHLK